MTDKGRRIVRGILIGLGTCAVLLIVVVVGFVMWLRQPGELIDPTRLVNADATGYLEWTLRADDPGTDDFLRLLSEALSTTPREADRSLPPVLGMLLGGAQAARLQQEFKEALPAVAVWTMHPPRSPGEQDLHLVSVTARHFGNRIVVADWVGAFMLGRTRAASVHPYRGENIFQLQLPRWPDELTFFARRGAVFATSDVDTAMQAVDLLAEDAAPTTGRAATALDQLFAATGAEMPLRAAVTNTNGELARLWERVMDAPPTAALNWPRVRGATISGAMRRNGSLVCLISFLTTETHVDAVRSMSIHADLERRFQDLGLDIDGTSVTAAPGAIRVELHVTNLVDVLMEHMQRTTRR